MHRFTPGWYTNMPITSLGGPLLGFKMSRNRRRYEKLRQEKAKTRKRTKCWKRNPPPPHCERVFWAIFHYETGLDVNIWATLGPLTEVTATNKCQYINMAAPSITGIYIYIYVLESYLFVHVLAFWELLVWTPRKLLVCPPLWGPFLHYTNRFFWGFFLCRNLVPVSVFVFSAFP